MKACPGVVETYKPLDCMESTRLTERIHVDGGKRSLRRSHDRRQLYRLKKYKECELLRMIIDIQLLL